MLDDEIENEICTDSNFGFLSANDSNLRSDFIFWQMLEQGRFSKNSDKQYLFYNFQKEFLLQIVFIQIFENNSENLLIR